MADSGAGKLSDNLCTHAKNVRVGTRVAHEIWVVTKPMPERSYAATPQQLDRGDLPEQNEELSNRHEAHSAMELMLWMRRTNATVSWE